MYYLTTLVARSSLPRGSLGSYYSSHSYGRSLVVSALACAPSVLLLQHPLQTLGSRWMFEATEIVHPLCRKASRILVVVDFFKIIADPCR